MSQMKVVKHGGIGLLPEGWKVVRLERVIQEIKNGFASGKRDDNGVVQIRMNNVTTDGRLIFDSYIKVPVPENVNDFLLKENDFLFNNTNSVDLVGKSTIFKKSPFPCTFSNHFTRIRFTKEVIPEWILFHFITLLGKGFFKSVAIRHVGQSAVHTKYLTKLKLPLPPLPEQKKIAEILSTVDKAIEKVDEAINKTQRLKKGLMQELLTGRRHTVVPDPVGDRPGKREFKETDIGRIPKEWEVTQLNRLIDIKSGMYFKFTEFADDGIRCLKIDNVGFGEVFWDTVTSLPYDYLNKFRDLTLRTGDMVIALNRPIINGKLKIGILKEGDSPSILYQRVGKVIFKATNLDRKFLFYTFTGDCFKRTINKSVVGTDQPYIRTPVFLKLKIPFPPLVEQKKIAEILSTVDKRLEVLRRKGGKLGRVKKGLMDDLLSGRKRVKVSRQ